MHMILTWIGGAVVLLSIGILAGVQMRDARYQRELAQAKAAFEQLVSEAKSAEEAAAAVHAVELARLKTLVDVTPANPTIALKKDAAGRVGAIK